MRTYWTLLTEEAWNHAQQVGYLQGDPEHIAFENFHDSYEWMKEQMKKRLPNYHGEQPVWLWPDKPDLRKTGHQPRGTSTVRLTLELQEEDVLISNFDEWHCVLNRSFNSYTEAEDQAYDAGKSTVTLEESWERIFGVDLPREIDWCGSLDDASFQGTTGRVDLSAVKKVEHFIAK